MARIRWNECRILMQDFMDKNGLVPDGDVFLFPIISYWVTNNPEEYINSLSVKVVPAGSK